jgi:hypothetical protein
MDDKLDPIEYRWIADFLGENWAVFLTYMADRDVDEAGCDALFKRLEQRADA